MSNISKTLSVDKWKLGLVNSQFKPAFDSLVALRPYEGMFCDHFISHAVRKKNPILRKDTWPSYPIQLITTKVLLVSKCSDQADSSAFFWTESEKDIAS